MNMNINYEFGLDVFCEDTVSFIIGIIMISKANVVFFCWCYDDQFQTSKLVILKLILNRVST